MMAGMLPATVLADAPAVSYTHLDVYKRQILNNLSTGTWTLRSFNDQLIELFTVIPRRMGNVRDHLAVKPEEFPEIISREQQLLDVMAGQVSDNTVVLKEVGDESKTVLEAFGLEFSPATDADIAVIRKQLGKECERCV